MVVGLVVSRGLRCPPLQMDRLKLTMERLDTTASDAEAVICGALQQHVEAKALVAAAQGQAETRIRNIGSADDRPVVVIDDTIAVQILIAEVARLHLITARRLGAVGNILFGIKAVIQVAQRLVDLLPRQAQPGKCRCGFILKEDLILEVSQHPLDIVIKRPDIVVDVQLQLQPPVAHTRNIGRGYPTPICWNSDWEVTS